MYKEFIAADKKTVDSKLPVGGWPVYPDYELRKHKDDLYLEAPPVPLIELPVPDDVRENEEGYWQEIELDHSGLWMYSPLSEPLLFLEFAKLFGDDQVYVNEAPPVVRNWAIQHGVLGRFGTYPTRDGGMVSGRSRHQESIFMFVRHSVEANRCLGLFSAAKNPAGLDAEKLRSMGVKGDTPGQLKEGALQEVSDIVVKHLENETCERLYRRRDGTYLKGPGFHSLLGAMYLQMANLMCAPEEDITFCRWCGAVVNFETGEPPFEASKKTSGKHKTHKNREFCKKKHGVEDWCKNQWNYDQRKKLVALGAEDARRGVHMRDGRPDVWARLTDGKKRLYDEAYQGKKAQAAEE